MGKKYLDTKDGTLESSILGVWQEAAKKNEDKLDPVNKAAVKKDFDDRKDKDIDNDGDVDSTDKYLHKRRKAVSKAIAKDEGAMKRGKDLDTFKPKPKKEEVELDEDASNFKSAVARIKKAKSAKDLKKLEKSFERVYKQTDALTAKEFGQLDDMISDKLVKLGEEVEESYEIGTDEYRDHTLEVTPGQSLTWGAANAYKQASMKEALAKVWGLDEKKLDKSEESDIIAPVKGKKSMTGGKVADVDVDPEMKKEDK